MILAQPVLTPVIGTGDTVAGMPAGYAVSNVGVPSLSPDGRVLPQVVLRSQSSPTDIYAILTGHPGQLRTVVRSDTPPPGMPAASHFIGPSSTPFFHTQVQAGGTVSFGARVAGGGVVPPHDLAYWREEAGQLTLRVRQGDAAPGTAPGVTLNSLNGAAFAASGDVVVRGHLAGPGITTANASGLWAGPHGGLQLLARQGDQAAGLPAGTNYLSVVQEPTINASGVTAFSGRTVDPQSNVGDGSSLAVCSEGCGQRLERSVFRSPERSLRPGQTLAPCGNTRRHGVPIAETSPLAPHTTSPAAFAIGESSEFPRFATEYGPRLAAWPAASAGLE